MNDPKAMLLETLLQQLRADLQALVRSQQDTSAAATHAENRAEHAKDTRATEQSYLARGLADRVAALQEAERRLALFEPETFDAARGITVGALVEIEDVTTSERQRWLLVPEAGGREIRHGDESVRTVTPAAPLGRAMLGLDVGDEGRFSTPGGPRAFEICSVS